MKRKYAHSGVVQLQLLVLMCLYVAGASASMPALIPQPASIHSIDGEWRVEGVVSVQVAEQLPASLDALHLLLGSGSGMALRKADAGEVADIRIGYTQKLEREAYVLRVLSSGVEILASSGTGVFYGLQTLRQLLPPAIYDGSSSESSWLVPAVSIEDEPRFAWRGMHLDVARHFMPVEFVKKFIDLLAVHKFNSFHWHLTEDQGWRIEIKRYPRLTEIGSQRAQTVVGFSLFQDAEERVYDGVPHGGFYTQDEIREVVSYAAQRHINVVPEIEFPGHAQAAIAAYPELGNTGEQLKVKEEWGISKNTIKPSDETLTFYRNVLTEVLALFPSKYIHIGGDEAPKNQWQESPYAQQRIAELGLADENALQAWLIQQMDDFLTSHGRKLVGWDEIMQGGLSSNATVMAWRGMKNGDLAARAGHDVVMAPTQWTYFDYYQADEAHEPLAIGSYLPLESVYKFDPIPEDLPQQYHRHILGAQGQLWSEFMPTTDHVEYMAFPRAAALAEVLWSPVAKRDYADFNQRLTTHLSRLEVLDVHYRPVGNDELSFSGRVKYWLFTRLSAVYHWYTDL